MTKLSSCRPALCFNDCGKDPYVGLSSFSLSSVVDVRTKASTLFHAFIQAHAYDARCTEGEDKYNMRRKRVLE